MTTKPEAEKDGLTFWPIPPVSNLEAAFGAELSDYFKRNALPEVPRKFEDIAQRLFALGGDFPPLAKGVDKHLAAAKLRSLLCSFAPSHEAKIATAAYALWVWSTPEIVGRTPA